jgi:hypothetical protein
MIAGQKEDVAKETEEGVWNLKSMNAKLMKAQSVALEVRRHIREEGVPGCESCVLADFNEAVEELNKNNDPLRIQRIKLPRLVVSDYLGEDKFDFIKDIEKRSRDGIRMELVRIKEFKCKKRGHGISVCSEPKYEHL